MTFTTYSLLLLAGSFVPVQEHSTTDAGVHATQHHQLNVQRASKFCGMDLHDSTGEQVASLTDVLVSPQGGNIAYAIVDLEGENDTREGKVIVPFGQLHVQPAVSKDAKTVVTLTSKPQDLAMAPAYKDGQEAQEGWCGVVADHYADYYAASGTEGHMEADAIAASYKPNGDLLVRSSSLMKHAVHGIATGEPERIGEIDEIVFDLNANRVAYCVVGVGGFLGLGEKKVAVPFGAMTVRETTDSKPDDREWFVTLPATKETFDGAPEYDADNWKSMCSPAFMDRAYNFYRVAPYWQSERVGN